MASRGIDSAQDECPLLSVRYVRVEDCVTSFGVQDVNALPPDAPLPGPRLYHGTDPPAFRSPKHAIDASWITLPRERVGLTLSPLRQ